MAGVALGTIVSAAVSLIVTPHLVAALGAGRFGAFRVISDWLSYLALIEWGIGGAVSATLAAALGRGDSDRVYRTMASALRIFAVIAGMMAVAGLVLMVAVPRSTDWGAVTRGEVAIAIAVALIPIVWSPASVFRALADAEHQSYLVQCLIASQAVLTALLSLAAAHLNAGLAGQSAALVLGQAPSAVILTVRALRRWPRLFATKADPEMRAELWKLNLQGLAMSANTRLSTYSDNIILGWAAGPAAVATLFLTQRFVTLVQGQLQGVGISTWAGFAELHARGEHEAFSARLVELTAMVSGFGAAILVPLAAYNGWLIEIWAGKDKYAGDAVSVLACAAAWLLAITGVWLWPIHGTANIGRWLPFAAASTAVNVGVSVAGAKMWGAPGPLAGTVVAVLAVQSWALPRMLRELFGVPMRALARAVTEPFIWAVPLGVALWAATQSREMPGLGTVALELGVSLFAGVALFWSVSLPPPMRLHWRSRFALVLGRSGGAA